VNENTELPVSPAAAAPNARLTLTI
jgi:Myb-like DNA-binding domain